MSTTKTALKHPDDLEPCPDTPNCVSSKSDKRSQHVPPIAYHGPLPQAMDRMVDLIGNMNGSRIVFQGSNYIHAQFRSRIFGFRDDLEMVFDDQKKVIHIRSASQTGYYDFGVNRKRVEMIRKMWKTR